MEDISIQLIRELLEAKAVKWTVHLVERLQERGINPSDVRNAISNGEIIEKYPTDFPYLSCLILGKTLYNKNIHIVCGIGDNKLWIITAYYPSLDKWNDDLKTRKVL